MALKKSYRSIPVLMYHHIGDGIGANAVSPQRFREQLAWLRRNGIKTLSCQAFEQILLGESPITQPSVVLTFDDGWLDNWLVALPILMEFDAHATFFVVSSWPGEGPMRQHDDHRAWAPLPHPAQMDAVANGNRDDVVMRWSEITEATRTGLVDIQSHCHTHGAWWSREPDADDVRSALESDLLQSRSALERRIGTAPAHLCWPGGRFTWSAFQLAEEIGFRVQYSTLVGPNHAPKGPALVVRRLNVEDRSLDWFSRRVHLYSMPLIPAALGLAHQVMFNKRMGNRYPHTWRAHGGLGRPLWRLA